MSSSTRFLSRFSPAVRRFSAKQVQDQIKFSRKPKFNLMEFEENNRQFAEEVTADNQYEKLRSMVLPFSNLDYQEQLKLKEELTNNAIDQVANSILWDKRIDHNVLKYVEFKEGQFCQVEPIISSPIIDHYRAKDDLSCGYSFDGSPTVGFYINPRNAKRKKSKVFPWSVCVKPLGLRSMKEKHIELVKHFDKFLKQHRLAPAENSFIVRNDQYWRSLILKSNTKDQLMMVVTVHPQSLSKNELDQLKTDLKTYFVDGPGRQCEIDSIYFQACANSRFSGETNPFELVSGLEFIVEESLGKKFRIGAESFLHVNKINGDRSIEMALKHAQIDENTILLDIGSGIGLFSVIASSMAKKVYAIDPSVLSMEEAKINAKENNCENKIEWISGFSESNFHRILKKIGDLHGEKSKLVAIVNPWRYNLSNRAALAMRNLSTIQRIVYILPRPDQQMMHNFFDLATSEKSKSQSVVSRPLVPAVISPIDVLPHTLHCELIVKCLRV